MTHLELERSPLVRERWPALVRMEQMVANIRVRAAGTIGGNLAFADPHSDPATFLLASDATVVLQGRAGERELPVDEFLLGPYDTALEPGECSSPRSTFPRRPERRPDRHAKLSFHERPAATVTCLVRVEGGSVAEARVAVGSVGPVPVRAAEAERLLAGLDAGAPERGSRRSGSGGSPRAPPARRPIRTGRPTTSGRSSRRSSANVPRGARLDITSVTELI